MYVWIWRHLPGNSWGRATLALVLFLAVAALLLFVVFPEVDQRLELWDPAL
jgi:hypothetical protein